MKHLRQQEHKQSQAVSLNKPNSMLPFCDSSPICLSAGATYDAHTYWNKASSSAAASSSDMSDLSSDYSASDQTSDLSNADQPGADTASLAAAVAAVDSAAEAAMEADAAFELPFLPESAAEPITAAALLQAVPPAVTALQNGISNLATAMKDLLTPDQASAQLLDQATSNAQLGSSDLTEVSIIATASTAALNAQQGSATAPTTDASQVQLLSPKPLARQQSKAGDLAFARQKSRTERRPKLLLLSNSLLMPLPSQSAAANAATGKQQIADALKRTRSIPAVADASVAQTGPAVGGAAAATGGIAGAFRRAKTVNKASFAVPDNSAGVVPVAPTAQSDPPTGSAAAVVGGVAGAFRRAKTVNKASFAVPDEASSAEGIASMRHASVTFKGSDKQHSPAAR